MPLTKEAEPKHGRRLLRLGLTALGVVFGDIGTSPLYVLRVCFDESHGLALTVANVLGVLSLIFWALVLVIGTKYLALMMRADNRGEGGVLALMVLARKPLQDSRRAFWAVTAAGIFGAAHGCPTSSSRVPPFPRSGGGKAGCRIGPWARRTGLLRSKTRPFPEGRGREAGSRERLFAWMSRNAQGAMTFFGLPPNRVIELGVQVEL